MSHIFKIWSGNRTKKAFVTATEPDLYNQVVLKASTKLEIDGSIVVLNVDGTPIDDDEILVAYKHETLLLLRSNECWVPEGTGSNDSLATTISVSKAPSVVDWLNNEIPTTLETLQVEENVDTNAKIINFEVINFESNTDYLWSTFEIPWNKMSQDVILMCEKGKCINKATISDIVHIIVNDLRGIKESIPSKVLKCVANKMVAKYPNTFRDIDDDGMPIGDGSATLFCKLYERASYLRRPHKRGHSNDISVPPELKKKKLNIMAGCFHWAPKSLDLTCTKDQKTTLNHNITEETNDETLNILMENTYPEQRLFLNNIKNPPSVNQILTEWPVLLNNQRCISWHFNKLTGAKLENLALNIKAKAEKIKAFGVKKKIIPTTNHDGTDDMELVLEILALCFKENIKHFFCVYQNVSDENNNELGNAPCIRKIETENKKNSYDVYFEKKKIFQSHNFLDTVMVTFALYFILNLEYPKEISTLLEMIQRYFLKIHPDNGSKSKKITSSKRKVISIIKQLNE